MPRKSFAFINLLMILFSSSMLITSCKKEKSSAVAEGEIGTARFENNGNGWGNVSPGMVLRWNQAAAGKLDFENIIMQIMKKV